MIENKWKERINRLIQELIEYPRQWLRIGNCVIQELYDDVYGNFKNSWEWFNFFRIDFCRKLNFCVSYICCFSCHFHSLSKFKIAWWFNVTNLKSLIFIKKKKWRNWSQTAYAIVLEILMKCCIIQRVMKNIMHLWGEMMNKIVMKMLVEIWAIPMIETFGVGQF